MAVEVATFAYDARSSPEAAGASGWPAMVGSGTRAEPQVRAHLLVGSVALLKLGISRRRYLDGVFVAAPAAGAAPGAPVDPPPAGGPAGLAPPVLAMPAPCAAFAACWPALRAAFAALIAFASLID